MVFGVKDEHFMTKFKEYLTNIENINDVSVAKGKQMEKSEEIIKS